MQSVAKEVQGMGYLVMSATFVTGNLVASKLILSWSWPYFRLMSLAAFIIAAGLALALVLSQGTQGVTCRGRAAKWVIARGFCGSANFIFAVLAATAGAPVGDIGALGSINVVVAALFGRLFLGEQLGKMHIAGALCSVAGAVLISDPASFGAGGPGVLGYVLALLSGAALGFLFVSSRKVVTTGGASSMLMTVSAMAQRSAACLALAYVPAIGDNSLSRIAAAPGAAVGFLVLLVVVTFAGNYLASVGSKICPAAISATVMTATNMGVGYLAQVVLFQQTPKLLTVIGACLMLVAVVIMALARMPRRPQPAAQMPEECAADDAGVLPHPVAGLSGVDGARCRSTALAGSQSLASFIASEFAEEQSPRSAALEPSAQHVRQRSVVTVPTAIQVGAANIVAASS